MDEEFLYYIWQHKLFSQLPLETTQGERLTVLHSGLRNENAGPDFTEAKVKLNNTVWAGNVEIHVRSSDWNAHGHEEDKNYANIILHVVYEDDQPVLNKNLSPVPTLVLKGLIEKPYYQNYVSLKNQNGWIPCEKLISRVDDFAFRNALHRLAVERLEQRSVEISDKLLSNKNNWEETLYQLTARNFGLKINTEPFELLAKSLPQKILTKHKNSLFQIEALLFGQAGMLDQPVKDEYPNQLKSEYAFLQKKYNLKPVPGHLWKFLRLRPAAFPTVRIAQFAYLVHRSSHLFSAIIGLKKIGELKELFSVGTSAYWEDHYLFDVHSVKRKKIFGAQAVQVLLINAVVPVLFVYGQQKDNNAFKDRALSFLEQLPAEKNSITLKWTALGYKPHSAYESQAMLLLKRAYCDKKQCLRCFAGNKILTS